MTRPIESSWARVLAAGILAGAFIVRCAADDTAYVPSGNTTTGNPTTGSTTTGGTCVPYDAGGKTTWEPPRVVPSACTPAQLEAYYDACFASGGGAACDAFQAGNSACVACMVTNVGSSAYGAVVRLPGGTTVPNVAGCLALVDGDSSATSCGAAYWALQSCQYTACGCAPTHELDRCLARAESFCAGAATAMCARDARYDACFYMDARQFFYGLGLRFCAAPQDAGSAGADAGPE